MLRQRNGLISAGYACRRAIRAKFQAENSCSGTERPALLVENEDSFTVTCVEAIFQDLCCAWSISPKDFRRPKPKPKGRNTGISRYPMIVFPSQQLWGKAETSMRQDVADESPSHANVISL